MPNFYWNNTFAPTLKVAGELEVDGSTSLQSLVASSGTYSGNLAVSGLTTLADLDVNSISASGTLTVDGVTSLAALSATSIEDSGTLSVNGSSSLESTIMQSASISNNLTVSGNVTLNSSVSGTTTINGDLSVSGSSTLQTIDFQGGSSHGNIVFDAHIGPIYTMSSGYKAYQYGTTSNEFITSTYNGSTFSNPIVCAYSGSTAEIELGVPVIGNEVGTSAIAVTYQGVQTANLAANTSFTPVSGTYVCGSTNFTGVFYAMNSSAGEASLGPIAVFDGNAYIHNQSTAAVTVYVALLGT